MNDWSRRSLEFGAFNVVLALSVCLLDQKDAYTDDDRSKPCLPAWEIIDSSPVADHLPNEWLHKKGG